MTFPTGEKPMIPNVAEKTDQSRSSAFSRILIYLALVWILASWPALLSHAQQTEGKPSASTELVDPFMGDWQGTWRLDDGTNSGPLAAQVIALGKGQYRAKLLEGFAMAVRPYAVLDGRVRAGQVHFSGQAEYDGIELQVNAGIGQSKFTGGFKGRGAEEQDIAGTFMLERVVRLSPTLGAKPPAGAIVLFDGTDFDQWKQIKTTFPGLIDIIRILGQAQNSAAYLRSRIWSDRNQQATALVGSDDGVKVWLNGRLVHANNAARGLTPGNDEVKVTLEKGWNTLMLKVTQGGGDWAACARLVDGQGKKLANINEMVSDESSDTGTNRFLEKNDGYLTSWQISGPYQEEGKNASEIFDIAFAPERPDARDMKWKMVGMHAPEKRSVQWKLVDGAMQIKPGTGSIITKKNFADFKLHLEFRTPFMPEARGQGRGNSGVYLQGRYEIQILDSYGLAGRDNECGGIYKVAEPRVNMCAPPMQWQTYDITFHAPRFDDSGDKRSDACLTTFHNGVKIHDKVRIPNPTGGAVDDNVTEPGGIYLQDHGNPVQFRNIWLVELPE
jgi:hypothetical protein